MSNEIVAYFKGRTGIAESVYQYDYGKVLVIDGLSLPAVFEAHFANTGDDSSTTVIGQNNRVAIPNACLTKTGVVTVYIYLHTGENDGEVEYVIKFAVTQRARPAYDSTDDERTQWETAASMALAMLQNSRKVNNPLDAYNQVTYGTNGQLLRTKGDGSTEWVDEGLPTDEQTAQAVSNWLDDHPEATTTVQDGSLTKEKFSTALQLKTLKDYVTPEMFGATGDGTTDDTEAVQAALSSGHDVYFEQTYLLTEKCTIEDNIKIFGCGTLKYVGESFDVHDNVILYFEGATKVSVKGLHFSIDFTDKTQTETAGRTYFIWVRAKTQIETVEIKDCVFTNLYGYVLSTAKMFEGGIWIGTYAATMSEPAYPSAKYVLISDNVFNNCTGRIIYTTDCGEVIIDNNAINNAGKRTNYVGQNFTYAIRCLSNQTNWITNNKITFASDPAVSHSIGILVSFNDEYLNKSRTAFITNNYIDASKFEGIDAAKCRIIYCHADLAIIDNNVAILSPDYNNCTFVYTQYNSDHSTLCNTHFRIFNNIVYNCDTNNLVPDTWYYTYPAVELVNNTFYGKSLPSNIYLRSSNTNYAEYICRNNRWIYGNVCNNDITVWATTPTRQVDKGLCILAITNSNISNYVTGNTLNIPSYLYNTVTVNASSITNGFNIKNILINGEVPINGTKLWIVNTGDGNLDCKFTTNTSGDGGIRAGEDFVLDTHKSFTYIFYSDRWRKG